VSVDPEEFRPLSLRTPEDLLAARRMGPALWLVNSPPAVGKTASPPQPAGPGFFVDFTDHEDLLAEFESAAKQIGYTPGESALDLIYLFVAKQLQLLDESNAKRPRRMTYSRRKNKGGPR